MEVLFGKRLRQLRNEMGLKQSQLAEALGLTQRKVSYFETGTVEPDLYTLCKLADYFKVTTDFLLGRTEF